MKMGVIFVGTGDLPGMIPIVEECRILHWKNAECCYLDRNTFKGFISNITNIAEG